MTKKRTFILVGLALVLALGAIALFSGAIPAVARDEPVDECNENPGQNEACRLSETSSPASGDGIVPELWNDNPFCSEMGFGNGFKLETQEGVNLDGTYTLTSDPGILTGGALEDPNNSVTISNYDGIYFDWSATLGIDAVFVKGGSDGNLYVYDPDEDTPDDDTADEQLSTPSAAFGISHVEFCYDYELDVDKDANTSFTRTFDWTITKEADASYDLFEGDTQDHKYTVSVDKDEGTDSDWAVSGSIYIDNNTPFDATIESVTDVVSPDIAATADCGVTFPYTLLAGNDLTCSYSADLGDDSDRTNTATVTTSGDVGGGEATVPVLFDENTTINEVNDEVTVTDTNSAFGGPHTVSEDTTFASYEIEFACDADEGEHVNTAEVRGDNNELLDSATATVTINCYDLTVTKDATTSLTRTYQWDITKTPDDTYDLFKGDTQDHKYTVSVDKTGSTDSGWAVSGNISVSNVGNPIAAEITDVTDVISGFGNATVDCGVTFPHIIAAEGTLDCTYSASLPNANARTNTATATLQNYDYASDGTATEGGTTDFSSEPVAFDFDPADNITEANASVTVTDTNAAFGGPYTVSEDTTFASYEIEFACDADEGEHVNTAEVRGDDNQLLDSDTATVTINCYDLTVTKDAEGTYDERHIWDIEKFVDPESQSGYPGDELSWEWKVTLSESSVDENFALTDSIIVSNEGNPIPAEITDVIDVVSDEDGILADVAASVDCGVTFPHTIAAGGKLECTYDAGTADLRDYELNTATATLQNQDYASDGTAAASGTTDYSGGAPVNYTKTVLNGTATVTDDQIGLNESVTAGQGPWEWTVADSHICSSDWADYGADGTYSATLNNTATVTASDGQTDSADASTTYTCEAGTIDVLKLTNGAVDDSKDWQFALYIGPDGFGGTQVGNTSSTLGDTDGILDFGDPIPALRPDTTYTVCELGVPAAWSTEWSINGTSVNPYNPNGDDNPPEDFGNRCFDVGAGTNYPVTVGQNLRITVDNLPPPGGEPRTPGYWKNWNTCSGGNQAETAAKNGGPDEGFFLLDDLLPITIGDFTIADCATGVSILDQRSLQNGKKMAKYAEWAVARNLLAAKLNLAAGAESCEAITVAVEDADALLASIGFDGTKGEIRPKKNDDSYQSARALADTLDQYNNGLLCSP